MNENFAFDLGEEIGGREVTRILEFNRERRRFSASANENRYVRNERLIDAIQTASATDNHHLLYWLVRFHAANLCGGNGRIE
jgi:hypothetical protein